MIKTLEKNVNGILASDTPEEYIKAAGVDILKIYKELGDIALNAELVAKDKYGESITLGRDSRSRLMAIGMLLELKKHLKDKGTAVSVAVFNDPKVEEEAKRIIAKARV